MPDCCFGVVCDARMVEMLKFDAPKQVVEALEAAIPEGEQGLTPWEAYSVFAQCGFDAAGPSQAARWLRDCGWIEIRPHSRLDRDASFRPGRNL